MKSLIALFVLMLCVPCYANPESDAEAFFQQYIELSDAFDVRILDLYSDKAKIHTPRVWKKSWRFTVPRGNNWPLCHQGIIERGQ